LRRDSSVRDNFSSKIDTLSIDEPILDDVNNSNKNLYLGCQ